MFLFVLFCFVSGKKIKGKRGNGLKWELFEAKWEDSPVKAFRLLFFLVLAAHVENSTLSNHNILIKVFIAYSGSSLFAGVWCPCVFL